MNSVKLLCSGTRRGGGWFVLPVVLFCLMAGAGCGGGKGDVDTDRFSVLGTVMAEQTRELCQGKGSVVLLISENDFEQATPYGLAWVAFCKGLEKTSIVSATERVKTPAALGPGSEPLPAAKLAELLQKHSSADYLVSFIRVPNLSPEQIAQLPSPRPQVVAVVTPPQLGKAMFTSRVLCLAAMVKPGAPEGAPGASTREYFDAQYQLVTPENKGVLPY